MTAQEVVDLLEVKGCDTTAFEYIDPDALEDVELGDCIRAIKENVQKLETLLEGYEPFEGEEDEDDDFEREDEDDSSEDEDA